MKNTKQVMLQQGDVLISSIQPPNTETLSNAKTVKRDKRGFVLAEGEVTGHYHGIQCEESDMELIQIGEKMLANIKSPVCLTHQEHKPITIPVGWYEIGIVVEEDEFGDMVNVRD